MDYETLLEQSEDEVDAGRIDSAKEIVQKGLKHARAHKDDACAALLEAELAYLDEDFDTAVELAQKAMQLDGEETFILRCTGVYLCLAGREGDGMVCFERALRSNPDDSVTLREKGITLAELGRLEEALECFDKALAIDPGDSRTLQERAGCQAALGR